MLEKRFARIEATEMGNSQAVLEYVAIAGLVICVCAAGFVVLGQSNNGLLAGFTDLVDVHHGALNEIEKPGGVPEVPDPPEIP